MVSILYCEDEDIARNRAIKVLTREFPAYEVVASESVRSGLEGITKVSLHPKHLTHISQETILKRLKAENASLSNLGIAVTDGNLIDPFAGAGDEYLNGWNLAQILRGLGYQGKIVYIGFGRIPKGKENLFNQSIPKYDEKSLIRYIRDNLQ